jgi:hypothetical protein
MDLAVEATVESAVSENQLVEASREDFRKLHDAVKLIVDSNCTDCVIEEGVIRQTTNDKQCIVQIDMSSILPDLSIGLSNAKQKVGLMRIILNVDESVKLKDQNVYIQTLEKNFKLSDERWEYSLSKPIPDLMDNKFIEETVFKKQIECSDDDLILSVDLDPDIIRGVQQNCELFQNNMVTFILEDDKADIKMSENSNTNSGKIKSDISLNVTDVAKSQFRLFSLPFRMDLNSSMQINVWRKTADKYLCQCSLELDGSVPVTVFTQVKLTELK